MFENIDKEIEELEKKLKELKKSKVPEFTKLKIQRNQSLLKFFSKSGVRFNPFANRYNLW